MPNSKQPPTPTSSPSQSPKKKKLENKDNKKKPPKNSQGNKKGNSRSPSNSLLHSSPSRDGAFPDSIKKKNEKKTFKSETPPNSDVEKENKFVSSPQATNEPLHPHDKTPGNLRNYSFDKRHRIRSVTNPPNYCPPGIYPTGFETSEDLTEKRCPILPNGPNDNDLPEEDVPKTKNIGINPHNYMNVDGSGYYKPPTVGHIQTEEEMPRNLFGMEGDHKENSSNSLHGDTCGDNSSDETSDFDN